MAKCPKCKVEILLKGDHVVQGKTKDGEEMDFVICPQCKTILSESYSKIGRLLVFVLIALMCICYSNLCFILPGHHFFIDHVKYIRTFWYLSIPTFLILILFVLPRYFRMYDVEAETIEIISQSLKEKGAKIHSFLLSSNWISLFLFAIGITLLIGAHLTSFEDVLYKIGNFCFLFSLILGGVVDLYKRIKSNDRQEKEKALIDLSIGFFILISFALSFFYKSIGNYLCLIGALLILLKSFFLDKSYKDIDKRALWSPFIIIALAIFIILIVSGVYHYVYKMKFF